MVRSRDNFTFTGNLKERTVISAVRMKMLTGNIGLTWNKAEQSISQIFYWPKKRTYYREF
jgi:hypothetical protein